MGSLGDLVPTFGPTPGGYPVANIAINATLGGVASELGGGKFANGAITSAFGYLYNKLYHDNYGYHDTDNGTTCQIPQGGHCVEEPSSIDLTPVMMGGGAAAKGIWWTIRNIFDWLFNGQIQSNISGKILIANGIAGLDRSKHRPDCKQSHSHQLGARQGYR